MSRPEEWWISEVCSQFSCVPSVAMAEIALLPMGLLEAIVIYRHYARAKADLEAAEQRNDADATKDPRFDLVNEIQFALAAARRQAKRQEPESS